MKTLEKREIIGSVVAITVVVILFFGGNIWDLVTGQTSLNTMQGAQNEGPSPEALSKIGNVSTTEGVEIYDLQVGTGAEAVSGKNVVVHYVGFLTDGTQFDSSIDRQAPFEFKLGDTGMMRGFNIGIEGMKVDGIRQIVVAPELAYGDQQFGPIPPNSTLVFQVQLLEVK